MLGLVLCRSAQTVTHMKPYFLEEWSDFSQLICIHTLYTRNLLPRDWSSRLTWNFPEPNCIDLFYKLDQTSQNLTAWFLQLYLRKHPCSSGYPKKAAWYNLDIRPARMKEHCFNCSRWCMCVCLQRAIFVQWCIDHYLSTHQPVLCVPLWFFVCMFIFHERLNSDESNMPALWLWGLCNLGW